MITINAKQLVADLRRLTSLVDSDALVSFKSDKKGQNLQISITTENYNITKILKCVVDESIEFALLKDIALKSFASNQDLNLNLNNSELHFVHGNTTHKGKLVTSSYDPPKEIGNEISKVKIPPAIYGTIFRILPKISLKPQYSDVEELIVLIRGTKKSFTAVITDNFHASMLEHPLDNSFDFSLDIPVTYGSLIYSLLGEDENFVCNVSDSHLSIISPSMRLVLPQVGTYISDYDTIINNFTSFETKEYIKFEAEDLKRIFKNIKAIDEQESTEITLKIKSNELQVICKSKYGEISDSIKISKTSKKYKIIVDKSITDIIQRLEGSCSLEINPTSNFLIFRVS